MNFTQLINLGQSIYETDDAKYNISIILNSDGNLCKLTQQNIKSLNIVDNFQLPFHSGVIDILNNNDILESSNTPLLKLLAPGFKFINNGRDFLFVYISPYTSNILDNIQNDSNIAMLFVVTGTEDIFIDGDKIKRIYLKDAIEEYLNEYKGNFSTGIYAYKISEYKKSKKNENQQLNLNKFTSSIKIEDNDKLAVSQLSNQERSLTTGQCLALLLDKLFEDTYIDSDFWDYGGPSVFYSETSNESFLEILHNLLKLHNASSSDKDKCYLNYRINLETNEYEWTFYSISYIFKSSPHKFLLEKLQLVADNMDFKGNESQSVNDSNVKTVGFYGNTGIINKFFFSDFSAEQNLEYIKSKFIYNYDNINKEFLIDCESSNFDNILKNFTLNYIPEKLDWYSNTPYNEFQLNNCNIEHIRNLYSKETNVSIGRNITMNNLIALNNSIQFISIGNTCRKSGYFILLEKENASSDNQFFNKILGLYFILSVHHIFADKRYTNNIIGSKPFYNFKPIASNNYTIKSYE